jgi:hypothetical protein
MLIEGARHVGEKNSLINHAVSMIDLSKSSIVTLELRGCTLDQSYSQIHVVESGFTSPRGRGEEMRFEADGSCFGRTFCETSAFDLKKPRTQSPSLRDEFVRCERIAAAAPAGSPARIAS